MHLTSSQVIIDATDDDRQTPVIAVRTLDVFLGIEILGREACFYPPSCRDAFRERLSFVSANLRKAEIAARNIPVFYHVRVNDQHFSGFILLLL